MGRGVWYQGDNAVFAPAAAPTVTPSPEPDEDLPPRAQLINFEDEPNVFAPAPAITFTPAPEDLDDVIPFSITRPQPFDEELLTGFTHCTGPRNPGLVKNGIVTHGGPFLWTAPANALSSDDFYATATLTPGDDTRWLEFTNFGFPLLTGGKIEWVEVEFEISRTGDPVKDSAARLIVDGVASATDKSSAVDWPTVDTYRLYRYTPAEWGFPSLTLAQVNSSGFGALLAAQNSGAGSGTARVDHCRITLCVTGGTPPIVWADPHLDFPDDPAPRPLAAAATLPDDEPNVFTPVAVTFNAAFVVEADQDLPRAAGLAPAGLDDEPNVFAPAAVFSAALVGEGPEDLPPGQARRLTDEDPDGFVPAAPPAPFTPGMVPEVDDQLPRGASKFLAPEPDQPGNTFAFAVIDPRLLCHVDDELPPGQARRLAEDEEYCHKPPAFAAALTDPGDWDTVPAPARTTSVMATLLYYEHVEGINFGGGIFPPDAPHKYAYPWEDPWARPVRPSIDLDNTETGIFAGLFGAFGPFFPMRFDEIEELTRRPVPVPIGYDEPPEVNWDPSTFAVYDYITPDDLDPIPPKTPGFWEKVFTTDSWDSDFTTFFGPTGADSLVIWFTGATVYSGEQTNQAASLGNFRSSYEAERIAFEVFGILSGVRVLFASRENLDTRRFPYEPQDGSLAVVDGNNVRYTAPGDSPGPITLLPVGTTKLISSGDPGKWIRVERSATGTTLAGGYSIQFSDQFNNVFGASNVPEALSAAGGSRYRAVMLETRSMATVTNIRVYLATFGSPVVTNNMTLPAAGAGTISGQPDLFCSWERYGYAQVRRVDGTLREIVYYSSRDATTLTVPATGRGLLGTVASGGVATDRVYPTAGVRFGIEPASPQIGGPIQTIPNESTAPSTAGFVGGTWSSGITPAGGVLVGDLATFRQAGLWYERLTTAGAIATPEVFNMFRVQYQVGAVTFDEPLAGLFRVADDDLSRYELYIGQDVPPNLAAPPAATSVTLPFDSPVLAPNHTYYLLLGRRNRFNMLAIGAPVEATQIMIDGGGNQMNLPPSAPFDQMLVAKVGGTFVATATYFSATDAPLQANKFRLYFRTNGTAPVPGGVDAPVDIDMIDTDGAPQLNYQNNNGGVGWPPGTTMKMIIRSFRSSDGKESTNTNVLTATMLSNAAGQETGKVIYRGIAEQK